jgi:preprotein translocase subunit SecY
VISSAKRQNDYQGYRSGTPERIVYISSIPVLIGAAMIAAAILLSTLVNALGTRYIGIDGPTEDTAWLIDRLTGSVYRCQTSVRGKASCETEISTGSLPEPAKQ